MREIKYQEKGTNVEKVINEIITVPLCMIDKQDDKHLGKAV